jgi:endonuclease G, mitochondrial
VAERPGDAQRFLRWIAPEDDVGALAESGELMDGVAKAEWTTDEDVERAAETVGRMAAREPLTDEDLFATEAIILPNERPVVDIVDGAYATPPAPFKHLGRKAARQTIGEVIPSIGRIELPDNLSIPYGGTGFVVGQDLLMTNRHVAELFTAGLGRKELTFRSGQSAAVDFLRERGRDETKQFRVERIAMIHPYWDMALLVTEGLKDVPALRLTIAPPGDLRENDVVVIGYPALDPRNDVEVQNRVFSGVFNVKRLQPGKLRESRSVVSFGHNVDAVTHDSSTLGGNSGSAVVDVKTGSVVALHFAGRYLDANFAVPSRELALDRHVMEAGVNFDGVATDGASTWDSFWTQADPETPAGAPAAEAIGTGLPLEITIQIRGGADAAAADAVERVVEPFHEKDYSNRKGYEDDFLGVSVPMPTVRRKSAMAELADGSHVLHYEHFSVVVNRERRLAQFTASNVDASKEAKEPEEGKDYGRKGLAGFGDTDTEKWFTDPRIQLTHQLPNRFYTKDRGAFDRGHIVRREDVAWGTTYAQVRRANGDTYHVTNCSPQVAGFNQSMQKGVWGQLENLILDQAETERVSLFAGPAFDSRDPIFVGVDDQGAVTIPIPRRFWKVVVARTGGKLQTFAFLLEQDLSQTDMETLEFTVEPAWRERMISVKQLDDLIPELSFSKKLKDSDQIGAAPGEALRSAAAGMETYAGG